MVEYTYKDIIIDPTSEEARNAVGMEVYFDDKPSLCLEYANTNNGEHCEILTSIDSIEGYSPFHVCKFHWSCIIVKKEDTYKERSRKWIKENDLKINDYVKVLRKAKKDEENWDGYWNTKMDCFIGKIFKVQNIDDDCDIELFDENDLWYFPYFVLEKVEPPEPQYIPFESAEEFIKAYYKNKESFEYNTLKGKFSSCGMWLIDKACKEYHQITSIAEEGFIARSIFYLWEEVFEQFEFLDGTQCGKLKEE